MQKLLSLELLVLLHRKQLVIGQTFKTKSKQLEIKQIFYNAKCVNYNLPYLEAIWTAYLELIYYALYAKQPVVDVYIAPLTFWAISMTPYEPIVKRLPSNVVTFSAASLSDQRLTTYSAATSHFQFRLESSLSLSLSLALSLSLSLFLSLSIYFSLFLFLSLSLSSSLFLSLESNLERAK
jgi:hypothetical protein